MCSQRSAVTAKDLHHVAKAPGKGKKKVQPDNVKRADTAEDELRKQVRKTLWDAAMSGKLDEIFPKALRAAGEMEPNTSKPHADPDSKAASSSSMITKEPAVSKPVPSPVPSAIVNSFRDLRLGSGVNVPKSKEQIAIDLEQLRQQARRTFCDAMVSGRLDKVIGAAKEKPATSAADTLDSSAVDIREQVRATLETAQTSGRLNEVLESHRVAKLRHQASASGRLAPNRREQQQMPQVQDTRDIDELLLELGESPTSKAG